MSRTDYREKLSLDLSIQDSLSHSISLDVRVLGALGIQECVNRTNGTQLLL